MMEGLSVGKFRSGNGEVRYKTCAQVHQSGVWAKYRDFSKHTKTIFE